MYNKLDLLINLLNAVSNDDLIEVKNEIYDSSHPLIIAAKYLANECLIGDDGHPIRSQMDIISENGFSVFPGEVDRFGWLTGCIELSRGLIIFG